LRAEHLSNKLPRFSYQGTDAELRGGSFGRRADSVQTGGQAGNLSAYLTADAINDNGWRE
jgi:iron complex outermembrane receptor protein